VLPELAGAIAPVLAAPAEIVLLDDRVFALY
jgi:hypothetical protein